MNKKKNLRDKKLLVLHQLNQSMEALSLSDLHKELNVSERTLRRWLTDLMKEGLATKIGQKRGTRYQSAKRSSIQKVEMSSCFSFFSVGVIEQIRRPIYERNPVSYSDEWFESYQPNVSYYLPENLREKLFNAGKRLKQEDPAGTYAHQIYNRLLIDLSYNSSRLEGNTYSLLDTERLLLEGASAEGKLDEEKIMILNHKEAIRYLVDTAPRIDVSLRTVCTLHYLLSDGLLESRYAGKVRDHAVKIGGSTYLPFEDSRRLQQQLERVVEKAGAIKNPFEQSLFLLIHLSYLQAFSDVNKRTARLSANIPLVKSNCVPHSFNDVERDDYTSAMIAVYELQDIRPMVDLYLYSYLRTCAMYDTTVKAMGFDEVRVRFRQQRREILREIILGLKVGREMNQYIASKVKQISEEYQLAFFDDVLEDLREISTSRIAGLGVSVEQLEKWQVASKSLTRILDKKIW